MKKIGWFLYGISLILMTVKLLVLGNHQLESFSSIYFKHETSAIILLDAIIVYGLIIDPFLISISIIGFIIRKNSGFVISLVYAYYVFGYHILSLFSFDPYHSNAHLGTFVFSLMILFFINIRPAVKTFDSKMTVKGQVVFNTISLFLGLVISEGLRLIVDSYVIR